MKEVLWALKKILQEMKICRLIPRLLSKHYFTLYWIGVFLLSIFCEIFNEFISLLVRERIFCQALVSKPTAQTISQQVQKPI